MTDEEITDAIAAEFATFGGKTFNPTNPISMAFQFKPLVFAMGVDVKSVVQFVRGAINDERTA